jgi:hypothetical protein
MFAARCIAVSLTFFVLLYSGLSLAASLMWELMRRVPRHFRIPGSASLLLGLRILPLLGAISITVAFSLPSFLFLEPRSTDEAIGTLPLALGFCSLLLLAAGITRASSAHARASQAVAEWLNGATMLEERASAPVFRTGEGTPLSSPSRPCARPRFWSPRLL